MIDQLTDWPSSTLRP